jgi:cation diffusion facilitator family transporter
MSNGTDQRRPRWLRWLRGHGHHHHHGGPGADAVPRTAEGIRALKVSLAALGLTAAVQFAIALASGSVALFADTIHNASDALTALPLWIAFVLARRPASARYTYGYGRAEDIAGLIIVVMIAASVVVTGWESIQRLQDPRPLNHVGWVILAGVIGALGNEAVARYRIRVGRRMNSAALKADGMHARADAYTSLGVVAGAVGVAVGFPLADPIAGLIITVMILQILRTAAGDVFGRLLDRVDPDLVQTVHGLVAATPGVEGVDEIRLRWTGHRLRADVYLRCAGDMTLIEAHAVAAQVQHRLLHDVPAMAEALVHTSPTGAEADAHHALLEHHTDRQ